MMAEMSVVQTAATASPARPYTPSLLDRFTDWVDSLSIPTWLFYAGLALFLVCIQLLLQWDGTPKPLYPFPYVFIVTIAYDLALMHYLDRAAARALARFRPILSISDAEYEDLLYRLTTLPARPTMVAWVIGAIYGAWAVDWVPYAIQIHELHVTDSPVSVHVNHALSLVVWGIVWVVIYHTVHQLRIVQQIYDRCTTINLFNLRPLYAFSVLSAQTAVGLILIVYVWYAVAPVLFSLVNSLLGLLCFVGFALLTFVLPLRGAHRLLAEEKDRLLNENGARQRAAISELHRRVDAGEIVDMDNLNKTMASLELEHAALERVSTWPWRPETLRTVAAALLFPVMVWLTQWVLQRFLSM
jgi:hypothetical protein